MSGRFGPLAVFAVISCAGVARAAPELEVELHWRGSCDDAEDLVRQVHARGAELELRNSSASTAAPPSVHVEVMVNQPAPSTLIAEIQLQSKGGEEARRVEAGACQDLRSAVAWVLVVLAQQRAPERSAPPASEREGSSTAVFPAPASRTSVPAAEASLPHVAQPAVEPTQPPEIQSSSARSAHRRDERVTTWGLGCSFVGAIGLLPAPSFGPMLFGRYHPHTKWLPTLQLSVQRLVTSDFESSGTSISLTRDAARLGAWVPLIASTLDLGLAAEAGRLVATGSGATLERGSSDSTLWFAFAVPVRLSIPLVGRILQAEFQLELDYSPVPYTFRYGSGDTLTSTAAFEGRGQMGLGSIF